MPLEKPPKEKAHPFSLAYARQLPPEGGAKSLLALLFLLADDDPIAHKVLYLP
jgi:hypothetical protein